MALTRGGGNKAPAKSASQMADQSRNASRAKNAEIKNKIRQPGKSLHLSQHLQKEKLARLEAQNQAVHLHPRQ